MRHERRRSLFLLFGGWLCRRPPMRILAAPQTPPAEQRIWVAQSVGTGTHSVAFALERGNRTVLVMNADGTTGVSIDLAVGATVPTLLWLVAILLLMISSSRIEPRSAPARRCDVPRTRTHS
jgi:hypothetical protein